MTLASIPTYFSHSYRPEDRASNRALWQRFADRGFYFTVDPPTDLASHTHLETMLLRSSCFVAVVNHRRENPPDYCSSFVLAELGLAVQSRTPKLLLVDEDVPAPHFDLLPGDERLTLRLDAVADHATELDYHIDRLRTRALRVGDLPKRPRNRVALLVPDNGGARAYGGAGVRDELARCAGLNGMSFEEVSVPGEHNGPFAMQLDRFECVILDVRAEALPAWVFAYVYGRFVPSIKLVRVRRGELASTITLPPLVAGMRMDAREPGVESVIYWRDPADLGFQVSRTLKRVARRGTALRRREEGLAYFDSIGRPPARLFVSNSWAANDFADALCSMLERSNIEAWQYKQPGAIPADSGRWSQVIERELEQCDVFVALLGKGYAESEWCRREMRRARQRVKSGAMTMVAFQLDETLDGAKVSRLIGEHQAAPVYRHGEGACRWVFNEIDAHLHRKGDNKDWRQSQPLLLGASREAIVDALRHLPPARHGDLLRRLADADIDVVAVPRKRVLQSRAFAEDLLRQVQRATDTPAGYGSTTAALVDALAELSPASRAKVLRPLLHRMEETMRMRRG